MDYEFWPTKNWVFISGSGSADVGVDDQIHFFFDPANPGEITIHRFICPHSGTPHGKHWQNAICYKIPMKPHDEVAGTTLTSLLPFTITSPPLMGKERLDFALPVEIPPGHQSPGGVPMGASWTAEEGGTGRTPIGDGE